MSTTDTAIEHTPAHLNDQPERLDTDSSVPRLPDPPARQEQDTQPMEGADAMDLPPGSEMAQRPVLQG
jgi:hypothetical protein